MLCSGCSNLDLDDLLGQSEYDAGDYPLHTDMESLRASARRGCEFCYLVHDTLLERAMSLPGVFQGVSHQQVKIGVPSRALHSLVVKEQGTSELCAWIGDGPLMWAQNHERRQVSVRFSLCLPRSDREWESGRL